MSSNSPPNYVEGVPVKISEKYKPPPEIHLTTKLVQQLARTQQNFPVAFEDYNFDLERKIISKTNEWINYRLKEKTERQQRILQRELARKQRLEEEHKVKLNQVSYPSADELTSSCDEEDENVNEAKPNIQQQQQQQSIPSEKLFSENFNSNSILLPTQVIQPDGGGGGATSKKSHRRYASNSSNKIDFSFFESDTSPFDHLEMKSMNEMEELAKVLQSTNVESDAENATLERNNSSESESSENQKNVNENNNIINSSMSSESAMLPPQAQQQQQQQQHQQQFQSYATQNYQSSQQTAYSNNYYYGVPNSGASYAAGQFNASPSYVMNNLPNNSYFTQNYAVNHMKNYIMGHNNNNTTTTNTACEDFSDKLDVAKSNSVPDIIRELNDELNNSERRRIRNNSQNSHKIVKEDTEIEISPSKEDVELSKLSPKSQAMAKQISQMGFNQDLVIRVLNRIGDNDKKVVEHLISLSELLQMGFEESSVSEALIKFDNNKDRALDYLIS